MPRTHQHEAEQTGPRVVTGILVSAREAVRVRLSGVMLAYAFMYNRVRRR